MLGTYSMVWSEMYNVICNYWIYCLIYKRREIGCTFSKCPQQTEEEKQNTKEMQVYILLSILYTIERYLSYNGK